MKDYCPRSCDLCPLVPSTTSEVLPNPIVVRPPPTSNCQDKDKRCPAWAAYANQCYTSKWFMSKTCKKSCGLCRAYNVDLEDGILLEVDYSMASKNNYNVISLFIIILPAYIFNFLWNDFIYSINYDKILIIYCKKRKEQYDSTFLVACWHLTSMRVINGLNFWF